MSAEPQASQPEIQQQINESTGVPPVSDGGLARTVIPSAPAVDAITQTQIALNNLLDQVRETFLFLLEGAPPLDLNGKFVPQPEDTMKRWKKFRVDFEEEWRSGKSRKKRAVGDEAISLQDRDKDEDDLDNPELMNTTFTPPPISEQALDAVKSDALFRAQRIAAITQSIRGLLPQLPSTKLRSGEREEDIGDPHTSPAICAQLEYWRDLNESVEEALHVHSQTLHDWMKSVNRATREFSKQIVR